MQTVSLRTRLICIAAGLALLLLAGLCVWLEATPFLAVANNVPLLEIFTRRMGAGFAVGPALALVGSASLICGICPLKKKTGMNWQTKYIHITLIFATASVFIIPVSAIVTPIALERLLEAHHYHRCIALGSSVDGHWWHDTATACPTLSVPK